MSHVPEEPNLSSSFVFENTTGRLQFGASDSRRLEDVQQEQQQDLNLQSSQTLLPPEVEEEERANDETLDKYVQIFNALTGLTNICEEFEVTRSALPNLNHIFKVVERNHARHVVTMPYEVIHHEEQIRICEEQIRIKREEVLRRQNEDQDQGSTGDDGPARAEISRFAYQQQSSSAIGQDQVEEPVAFVMPEENAAATTNTTCEGGENTIN